LPLASRRATHHQILPGIAYRQFSLPQTFAFP
jgi:hypothetical protein